MDDAVASSCPRVSAVAEGAVDRPQARWAGLDAFGLAVCFSSLNQGRMPRIICYLSEPQGESLQRVSGRDKPQLHFTFNSVEIL